MVTPPKTMSTRGVSPPGPLTGQVYVKDTLINGSPANIRCIDIAGQTYSLTRGLVRTVRLEDEWFQEVNDPLAVVAELRNARLGGADLFTFCQRLPNVEPRFAFRHEAESIAALRIESYDYWWGQQIESATRNKIRKSVKLGVEVRVCAYDDEFVKGMTAIFNETPVRQGRRFWHYGKDVETVRRQFSRYLFREELIGAYYQGTLIGFAMVGRSETFADLGQIISMVQHRDKAPTNALIAKAVELCAARQLKYLVYAFWTDDSLGEFKRQSGFAEIRLPRYFVPLTLRGSLALRMGLHRNWRTMLPSGLLASLKNVRRDWYAWREK